MSPKTVFLFPGQSSRYPSMISRLVDYHPPNGELLEAASDTVHRDLAAHYREDNPAVFARNRDIQVGVFLANAMHLAILESRGIRGGLSLGLSLGEYTHLVHIGALELDEALQAVEARGLAYDEGPPGAMVSVFPMGVEELEGFVERARAAGIVEIVNLNSPRQQVLAGETPAIREAMRILEQETYARTVVIEDRIPMHCSTFEPVGRRFREHLEGVAFRPPHLPYFPNRLGHPLERPSREDFVELLATHVHRPVLWRHSVEWIVGQWPDALFVEVGPRQVLSDLLHRKWHPFNKVHTDGEEDLGAHLDAVLTEVANHHAREEAAPEHVL